VRFILFFFSLQYWGMNSGPSPGATPPALFLQGDFSRWGLVNYLPRHFLSGWRVTREAPLPREHGGGNKSSQMTT
jgi:hypothetical protein